MRGRAFVVAALTIGWPLLQIAILTARFGNDALINVQDEIAPYVFFGFLSGTFLTYALRREENRHMRWGVVGGFIVAIPVVQWATAIAAVSFPPWIGIPVAGLIAQFLGVALGRMIAGLIAARGGR